MAQKESSRRKILWREDRERASLLVALLCVRASTRSTVSPTEPAVDNPAEVVGQEQGASAEAEGSDYSIAGEDQG